MANLSDDHIRWILDMDAKGVQSELTKLSSQSRKFIDDNKRMNAEIKAAEKQMKEAEKAMDKLTKAGKEDSDTFKALEKTYESAREEIISYRQQIEKNNKAIEENNRKHNEIIRTMRIEDMTMAQLEQRAKSLEEQLRHTSESAEPEAYRGLNEELTLVRIRMGEVNSASKSMFSVFKGGLAVFAGNLMTKAFDKVKEGIKDAKEFVKEGIEMAKSAEGVVTAFNKFDNAKKHLSEMRKATRETISDLKLMEKTVRADEMGIGIQNMAKLMKFAQQQAKKMKTDVDYMANSIVDGLGRKSTMILDNLGISASQVQQEVKRTGDFTAAVLKIVNERLKEQGDEALTGAEKATQSAAKWENAQLKVGQKFQWLGETWDSIKGRMADQISELIGDTRSLSEQYQDQIEKVADLEENTVPLVERYEELRNKSSLTKDENIELNRIMNTLSQTIPGVVTEFDKYGNVLSINTQKVYDFIEAEKAKLKYMNRDAIKQAEEDIEDYTKVKESTQAKYEKGFWEETITDRKHGETYTVKHYYTPEQMQQFQDEIKEYGDMVRGAEETINDLTGKSIEEQIENQKKLIQARGQFNGMNKKELDAWIKDEKNASNQYLLIAKQIYDQRFGTTGGDSGGSKTDKVLIREKKDLSSMLEKLDTTHNEKLANINQDYLDGKIKTTADLNRSIHAQEQAYYSLRETSLQNFKEKATKLEVKNDVDKLIAQQQNERLSKEISFRKKFEKIIIDADPTKKEMERYKEALSAYELYGETQASLRLKIAAAETEEEKKALEQKYQAFLILEKEHQDNLKSIKNSQEATDKAEAEKNFENEFKSRREEMQLELNDLMQQAASASGSASLEAEMAVHLQRLNMINEEVAARTNAGLDIKRLLVQQGREEAALTKTLQKEVTSRYKSYNQYTTSLGTAVGNLLTGQQDAMKAFGSSLLDIFFDIISKIIETKIMEATAVAVAEQAKAAAIAAAMPDSVATFGASAAARTAAIGAIIMGALQVAKTVLKSMITNKSSTINTSSSGTKKTGERVYSGFADGGYHEGYTGDGTKYEVKGFFPDGEPYHAGEYIITQEKLKIPWVANVIRKVDSITTGKENKHPLPDGFAEGGYHSDTPLNLGGMDPSLVKDLVVALNAFNKKKLSINYYEFEKAKKVVDTARSGASKRG